MPMKKNFGTEGADPVMFAASALKFKPLVYGYSNARVRAMRPHLLTRRQAEDLLKVQTTAAVIEYLSRTTYKNDFSGLPAKATDEERVELAVSKNFARTAQKLLRITPKKDRPTLLAFLTRYDIHNIKTILLSRKLGKPREETEALLVPAGSISQKELSSLLSAKGAEEFYALLRGTDFGSKFLVSASVKGIPKEQMKALFQNPGSEASKLDIFISALDFHYYETASYVVSSSKENDAQAILGLLRSEADAKNIMTALRLKRTGADKKTTNAHMVGGGSISRALLEKIAGAKDLHEAVSHSSAFFQSQTGKDEIAKAEERYRQDGQLSHFEVVFEKSIARRGLHALRRSIMSIGALVGFLFLKEEEMKNIHKIVRGKSLGLTPDRISEMLVLVG